LDLLIHASQGAIAFIHLFIHESSMSAITKTFAGASAGASGAAGSSDDRNGSH
jgi:hypothetical protein